MEYIQIPHEGKLGFCHSFTHSHKKRGLREKRRVKGKIKFFGESEYSWRLAQLLRKQGKGGMFALLNKL